MERIWALLSVVGLVALSIVKGYLGIDDASTALLSMSMGAILGYYFGTRPTTQP